MKFADKLQILRIWFTGYEEIFCNGVKVYECNFHGGSIE